MEITSWNRAVPRFLDPPRFTWEPIGDATFYRVTVALRGRGVVWEETVDTEAFDFARLWERLPVGEVAWAVTAWGAEGQVFGESDARRFHRAEAWQGPGEPPDPDAWEQAARRNVRYLISYRGPELGLFHRDAVPARCVAVPADPTLPPYRWHAAVRDGRYLLALVHPARDFPSLIDGFLTAADDAAARERLALLQRAAAVGEWLLAASWPEEYACAGLPVSVQEPTPSVSGAPANLWIADAARAARALWRLGRVTGRTEFGERAVRIARVLRERQGRDGAWPAIVDARSGEGCAPPTRTAASPARLLDGLAEAGHPEFAAAARKALAWLRGYPLLTHCWQAVSAPGRDVDLVSTEPMETVCLLLAHRAEEPELVSEAVRLHGWLEDVFVSYGADGSLAEEPHLPAAREWAGAAWVRECATARWLDTLRELHAATGDRGYAARADAASDTLTRFQRPDGRFSSFGLDRRLGQTGLAEDGFGDNALASAALLRWRRSRNPLEE